MKDHFIPNSTIFCGPVVVDEAPPVTSEPWSQFYLAADREGEELTVSLATNAALNEVFGEKDENRKY